MTEELRNKIMKTDNNLDMEELITSNKQTIDEFFCELPYMDDISTAHHILKTASTNFLYEFFKDFAKENGGFETYRLLYYILISNEPLFHMILNCSEQQFYHAINTKISCMLIFLKNIKQETILSALCKSLTDEEKLGYIFWEQDPTTLFENTQELVNFLSRIPIEKAYKIFAMLELETQKTIVMSDIEESFLFNLLYNLFELNTKNIHDKALKEFIYKSLVGTYINNHKTGLLFLLNISYFLFFGNAVRIAKYSNGACYSGSRYFANSYIELPKSVINANSTTVFFHEMGHLFFETIANDQLLGNFHEVCENTKKVMCQEKKKKINEIFESVHKTRKYIESILQTPQVKKYLRKRLYNNLITNITSYMYRAGYDSSLIKKINKDISELNINDISTIAEFAPIQDLPPVIYASFQPSLVCIEDIICSIFSGKKKDFLESRDITNFYGHPEKYYSQSKENGIDYWLQFSECMANFTSACLLGKRDYLNLLRDLIGDELFDVFKSTYLEFALYGVDKNNKELRYKIEQQLFYDSNSYHDEEQEEIESLTPEDIIEVLKGIDLFAEPNEEEFEYNDSSDTNNLPNKNFITLSKEEKIKLLKSEDISINEKQGLIRSYAMILFKDNKKNANTIISLVNYLCWVGCDIIAVYNLVEYIQDLSLRYPNFNLYDALYPDIEETMNYNADTNNFKKR